MKSVVASRSPILCLLIGLAVVVGCAGEVKPPAAQVANPSTSRRRALPGRPAARDQLTTAKTGDEGGGSHASAPSFSSRPTSDGEIVGRKRTLLSERYDLLAGWIDLLNKETLLGWTAQSEANWKINNGMLSVSEGEPGLLTTNSEFGDFHLRVDFQTSGEGVNSGIFLHTTDKPSREEVTSRCYELNIAPPSNPFPTGSIVGRVKSSQSITEDIWHSLEAKVEEGRVTIFIDGTQTAEYVDPKPLGRGKIGLQFNTGGITFREIKIRPLGLGPFGEGGGQAGWKLDLKGKTAIEETADGAFRLRGGKGYLESEKTFKDFILQVEAKTNRVNQNSGIFFRAIPGSEMDGYECQINNAVKEGAPLDYGTGGIFNRQIAQSMPAREEEWFALTVLCHGAHMACWVNGVQVSDWTDARPAHDNPRKGLRLAAGSIMLQGHDPNTDVSFQQFRIAELPSRTEPEAPETKTPTN